MSTQYLTKFATDVYLGFQHFIISEIF